VFRSVSVAEKNSIDLVCRLSRKESGDEGGVDEGRKVDGGWSAMKIAEESQVGSLKKLNCVRWKFDGNSPSLYYCMFFRLLSE